MIRIYLQTLLPGLALCFTRLVGRGVVQGSIPSNVTGSIVK